MRALILTDAESRGALAGARALATAGWHVSVGAPAAATLAGASRAVQASHVVAPPQAPSFADDVARVVEREGVDVVFPAGDDWVLASSASRDRIGGVVPYPPDGAVRLLLDKQRLAATAAEAGIAVPVTTPATPDALARWQGPAVVKAALHWATTPGARTRWEAALAPDATAAATRVAEIEAAGGEAVLQQVIDGRLTAVAAVVDHDGRVVGAAQQRAEGLWPLPFGVSTRAVTIPVEPEAVARVARLARAVGWHGLVEAQFLVDGDECWWLVDVNARLYGSLRLAVAAGVNLPDLWGRLALGQVGADSPPTTAKAGVRYCWLEGDLRRAWAQNRPAEVVGSLGWAATTAGREGVRDPGPALWATAALARRAAAKVRRAVGR